MDQAELDGLLDESENDSPPIKEMREALKRQAAQIKEMKESSDPEEIAALREFKANAERSALFDAAGIPSEGSGALLREAMKAQDDLTEEMIKAKAQEYGVLEAPKPEASAQEQQSIGNIDSIGSAAPPAPTALETKIAEAQNTDEVLAALVEDGWEVDNGPLIWQGVEPQI